MTDAATSWAEQEAIEKWWNKHKLELKQSVTAERVRLAGEVEELEKELVFVRAVIEKCTPSNYASTEAENERLKKLVDAQVVQLLDSDDSIRRLKEQVDKLEAWIKNQHLWVDFQKDS